MSLFKLKNNKVINYDTRCTLDVKHNNMLDKFKEERATMSSLRKKISYYTLKLNEYNSDFDIIDFNLLYNTRNKLDTLQKQLADISSNNKTYSYYLDTSDILTEYYSKEKSNEKSKEKSNEKSNEKPKDTSNKKSKDTSNSVIDFFNNINSNESHSNESHSNESHSNESHSNESKNKISYYVNKTDVFNKALLLDSFLQKTNDSSFELKHKILKKHDYCTNCNAEMYINQIDGVLICSSCGYVKNIIIDSDKPNYKDPPPEISYFAYKRINHFNEWLAQFQAKESTDVPQDVFNKIILEIKKERIQNTASLTNTKIREYLKKLKLNKFYEHVPHIINKINGLPPPIISKDIEDKLRIMFREIQTPFSQVCPKDRKNFLSYSYVLHKFVELLELNEYKACFPLLKSREKLHQQDMIWKDICKKLDWQYIKSI